MLAQLLPCGGGVPIPLTKPNLVIGRKIGCDIILPIKSVSSQHCQLELKDKFWFVRDLGSKNGIRVDGIRCDAKKLPPGSVLWIANHRFEVDYASGEPAPEGDIEDAAAEILGMTVDEGKDAVPQPSAWESDFFGDAFGELNPCGGGDPIPLLRPKLVIGRALNCDIVLRFPAVSATHCELEFKDGYWYVRDLNSSNGVRVNGMRTTARPLMPGDVLWIAKLRYEVCYTATGDEPPMDVENIFSQGLLEKAGLVQPPKSRE